MLFRSLTAYPGKLVGGKVWFNGHEIENMKEKDFRKIRGNEVSIIFQDPMTSLNPVYTIGNQIVEVIRHFGVFDDADVFLLQFFHDGSESFFKLFVEAVV